MKTKENRKEFLEPENMNFLGFDCLSDKDGLLKYESDGMKHHTPVYNKYPKPKGTITIYVHFNYEIPLVVIKLKKIVYHGFCETEMFLKLLLEQIEDDFPEINYPDNKMICPDCGKELCQLNKNEWFCDNFECPNGVSITFTKTKNKSADYNIGGE